MHHKYTNLFLFTKHSLTRPFQMNRRTEMFRFRMNFVNFSVPVDIKLQKLSCCPIVPNPYRKKRDALSLMKIAFDAKYSEPEKVSQKEIFFVNLADFLYLCTQDKCTQNEKYQSHR